MSHHEKTGFYPADILLPEGIDMTKWSVVACDQYTSEPEYWEDVSKITAGAPSTLNMIIPEAHLEWMTNDKINEINSTMNRYIPLLKEYKNTFIYVRRQIGQKVRHGIIGAVDLEEYDYTVGSSSLIRATEGTVLERIPPRVRVRKNAPLELPHIMLLIDDCKKTVIEPLDALCANLQKVYDFKLMQGGGNIEGYLVAGDVQKQISNALLNLRAKSHMLFAAGDGNHSLATAKACYENIKKTLPPDDAAVHPARYALVEVVNIHDDALEFEPIHRVVFGCEPEKLLAEFEEYFKGSDNTLPQQSFKYYYSGKSGELVIKNPSSPLNAGTLQQFLDYYENKNSVKIDYIHGEDVTKRLGTQSGNIGFVLPPMPKDALFKTVLTDGILPHKTFSMGEANEKRFYLECRKIV